MKQFAATLVGAWMALASATVSPSWAGEGEEKRLLTRSIYVPVHFAVDEELLGHIDIWIEQDDGEDMRLSTRPHTFMFTYYPGQGQVFRPERIEVRLQADEGCAETKLDTNFFVTPFGIQSSEEALAFDLDEMMKQLRLRKRDLHVTKKLVRIKCPDREASSSTPAPNEE